MSSAEARYKAALSPDDDGDFCCGLPFVMATYNPRFWLTFFDRDDVERGHSA